MACGRGPGFTPAQLLRQCRLDALERRDDVDGRQRACASVQRQQRLMDEFDLVGYDLLVARETRYLHPRTGANVQAVRWRQPSRWILWGEEDHLPLVGDLVSD